MKNTHRWTVVHKTSGKTRNSFITRDLARANKKSTERIYDTWTNSYIR